MEAGVQECYNNGNMHIKVQLKQTLQFPPKMSSVEMLHENLNYYGFTHHKLDGPNCVVCKY